MIQIILFEDNIETREIVKLILECESDFSLVASFSTVNNVTEVIKQYRPDVVLLDISMPGKSGLEVIELIKEFSPATDILMLTNHNDQEKVREAYRKGASGYMLKSELDTLPQAIRNVQMNHAHISSSIASSVINMIPRSEPAKQLVPLSEREKQVLKCIALGKQRDEIAEELHIKIYTVGDHIKSIYTKLQIHSKSQAVREAMLRNLV
jgi:DNA-binding NarL/FixJ family response regulator